MTILAFIFLVCSVVFFILLVFVCKHTDAIKRRFEVNEAAFDLLNTRYVAKCKAYDELADCIAKAPLPEKQFRYPKCAQCAKAYLNDKHTCNEADCMPFDKIDRDEIHEYDGFIPVKYAVAYYMAARIVTPVVGQVVCHKKTGNKYTVLYDAALDCTNSRDGTEVVVYIRNGKVFVREKQEFMEKFNIEYEEVSND